MKITLLELDAIMEMRGYKSRGNKDNSKGELIWKLKNRLIGY